MTSPVDEEPQDASAIVDVLRTEVRASVSDATASPRTLPVALSGEASFDFACAAIVIEGTAVECVVTHVVSGSIDCTGQVAVVHAVGASSSACVPGVDAVASVVSSSTQSNWCSQ